MKTLYLILSVVFTALIMFVAFTNIGSGCNTLTFFSTSINASPALILLSVAVLGILTGVFYHAFINRILENED